MIYNANYFFSYGLYSIKNVVSTLFLDSDNLNFLILNIY